METKEIMSKLKLVRINRGISQEKLAEEIGVTRASIINWESGKKIPNIENVIAICRALKVKIQIKEK